MSYSRHLNALQAKGILKAGDILLPGNKRLPAFSRTGSLVHVDRIVAYLTDEDRTGLRMVAALFGILPSGVVSLLLRLAAKADRFPRVLATQFRKLNIGIKGVVMTLYYSDATTDKRIHGTIGWDTKCGDVPDSGDPEQVFKTAREAQEALRRLTVEERLQFVRALREAILERQEWIIDQIQKDTAKSRTDALTSEIFGVLDHLSWLEKNSAKALRDRKVQTPPVMMGSKSLVAFQPLGTVLVISPWNYPFYQAIVPITSAFVCGNSVVYKPSEYTPLLGVVETLLGDAGVPGGFVQVVYGDGSIGRKLIDQRPDKIFFTGSGTTGSKIMEQAARHLIPVELELGGKDPLIVFEDANLDRAVAGAAWGALTNTGQSCTSVERILVQEPVYGKFRDRLLEQVKTLRLGVDRDGNAELGLMTNDMQVSVVAEHLDDALKKGARLLSGGEWDRKSRAIPPLLIENITPEMKIFHEETFGPVLPLIPFKSEEEAVRLANMSEYGLSASIWSADLERARRVADQVVTGNVSINNVMITEGNHALPFGGVKASGFGRYKGEFGLMSFSNVKSLMIAKNSGKIEANWYPYTAKKYKLFSKLIQAVYGGGGLLSFLRFALTGMRLESHAGQAAKQALRGTKKALPGE